MKKCIAVLFALMSVTACAGPALKESKGRVFESNKNIPAVVKVFLSPKGIPVVDIDSLVVDKDQRVVWVGPENMVVSFSKGSPFKERKFKSRGGVINVVANQKVDWKKDEKYRAFKYDIVVGDIVLDPILIRRRSF